MNYTTSGGKVNNRILFKIAQFPGMNAGADALMN
jgi:hypothetical protein